MTCSLVGAGAAFHRFAEQQLTQSGDKCGEQCGGICGWIYKPVLVVEVVQNRGHKKSCRENESSPEKKTKRHSHSQCVWQSGGNAKQPKSHLLDWPKFNE